MNDRFSIRKPDFKVPLLPIEGMELGLERALTLFEQLERPLASGQILDGFYNTVRDMTHTECLLVIESLESKTVIEFSHFDLEKKIADDLCREGGLYSELASSRFAHIYNEMPTELDQMIPKGHPPVSNLLVVPTQWREVFTGCLAVINRAGNLPFDQTDTMTLALAAMYISFAREYRAKRTLVRI